MSIQGGLFGKVVCSHGYNHVLGYRSLITSQPIYDISMTETQLKAALNIYNREQL